MHVAQNPSTSMRKVPIVAIVNMTGDSGATENVQKTMLQNKLSIVIATFKINLYSFQTAI
jgi:hypothetical protein